MLRPRRAGGQAGVTLTELMIALAILGIIGMLALPSFQTMIANTKVRGTAESFLTGLQLARSEAVRRNVRVRFNMPSAAAGWTVVIDSDGTVIQTRPAGEGSTGVTVTKAPSANTQVVFNSFGRTVGAGNITQINVSAAGANNVRRVNIGADGNIRMCDPSIADSNDVRYCS